MAGDHSLKLKYVNTTMILLFFAIVFINTIEAYQCRIYFYTGTYSGSQFGPYDVGIHTSSQIAGNPGPGLYSARIYAEGYWCYATLYTRFYCGDGGATKSLSAAPFGSDEVIMPDLLSCAQVSSVATPNPTKYPSKLSIAPTTPSTAPTTAPTSSCLDYNNETSSDGNNEIQEFNYKNIINISNYYINKNTVLEFNTSYDINYKNKLIECAVSDCIIQCHNTACLKTNIE
eukprot:547967_1